jgi:hypothetical protein
MRDRLLSYAGVIVAGFFACYCVVLGVWAYLVLTIALLFIFILQDARIKQFQNKAAQEKEEPSRTILYLINIPQKRVLSTFEGRGELIPEIAQVTAQEEANLHGDAHVIAKGELFFQEEK